MSCDWPNVALGKYCSKIGSGATPKGGSSVYLDNGEIALIRSQNIYNEGFRSEGLVYITPEAAQKLKNVIIEQNDILINITGDSVARVCLAPNEHLPARVNQHVAIIRVDPKEFDHRYLRYYLTSLKMQNYLLTIASSGATRNALTKLMLESLMVSKPPLQIQREIGDVLEQLENKIQLNTQTNQTLEAMAQAIFKSWFVDFDPVKAKMNGEQPIGMDEVTAALFPDKLVESEQGLIPDGWDITSIKDFGDVICGKTPSKKNADFYGGDVPFIKIPDTHGKVFITETTDTLTQAGDASQPKKRIPEYSICVSCIATVGQVFITTKPSHTNQQINSVIPSDKSSLYYLLFMFKGLHKHFHDLASGGSATLNMNTSTFSKVALVRPTVNLLEAFHKMVGGLMEKMLVNQLENSTLSELRDTLLPKLLSGEIELGQTEELAEASV
jgi:type I restriction enzyme S subunit